MINNKPQVLNRLLIASLHVVGWVTFILLPFLFMGAPRNANRLRHSEHFRARHMDMPPPQPGEFDLHSMRVHSLVFNVFLVAFFYLNMYVLIPKVLTRKSWKHYLLSIVLSFVVVVVASEVVNDLLLSGTFRPGRPFYFTVLNFLLVFGLSTALRLTSDRVQFERERKEKENETLKSELSLLRSQVSPHFMFNVLNNLASLARKKSDQLESVIIQLSHLMRYMLYESNEKRVTLDKEIEYLESYIDLQKLRFGRDFPINFDVKALRRDLPIEPMLLIPFVENAFKHGIGMMKDPMIIITLTTEGEALHFSVRNKFSGGAMETKDASSGIGIQNVRRRLDLLYKDMHELHIYESNPWYVVELKLILQ
ncbi:sensor histidine kinase [Chryseolinea lacunae]|uniref:Histidine kinase n=1 Tax=Chryseolinea lacunae TaxID=2801331 RepID=A0ABS1KLM9_9BACT|nr:histidine kinase [Chryseolinea lacunae]MBL0740243.1 histidine kinase [Chryseolinea lacunae]